MSVRDFSHDILHDNEMLIKQDGNLQKRHYTYIYIYMRCNYVHLQSCDINEVSLDRRMTILAFFSYFVIFSS